MFAMDGAHAQDTVCARVKIEIKQKLTLERQAFDAEMKINNTTDTGVIEDVSVVMKVTDENGTPVEVSDDPNNRHRASGHGTRCS
jgi:protocatechuate 3,4-dioxygenase beta subunit